MNGIGKWRSKAQSSTDDLAPGNVVLIGQSGFAVIDYIHNETADGSDMAMLALHSAFDPFSHLICAAVQKDQNIFLMFLAAEDGILTETSMHCAFESLRYKETELATRDPLLNSMKMLLRSADQFLGRIDVQALLRGQPEALDVRAFDGDDTAFDLLRLMSDPAQAMTDMKETQDVPGVLDYPGLLGGRSYDGLAFLRTWIRSRSRSGSGCKSLLGVSIRTSRGWLARRDQTLQAVRAKIAKTGTQAAELTELRGQEIKLQQLSDASALRIAEFKECIGAKSSGKIQRGPTSKWPKWCCKSSCSERGSNDAFISLDSGSLSTTEDAQNIDDDAQRREHPFGKNLMLHIQRM
ncbi:hypothetical protein L1887_54904 [Cichorium endivia]|nr:hypothetical protein L1887_54904 [Cichorium endivia]